MVELIAGLKPPKFPVRPCQMPLCWQIFTFPQRLANAVPRELADAFILFSKTGTFSPNEIALAKTLNTKYRRRVILWSREELEPRAGFTN